MSFTIGEMLAHLRKVVVAAHEAAAAEAAAKRPLSDMVADAHWEAFDAAMGEVLVLITGEAHAAIVQALLDDLQQAVSDLEEDAQAEGVL